MSEGGNVNPVIFLSTGRRAKDEMRLLCKEDPKPSPIELSVPLSRPPTPAASSTADFATSPLHRTNNLLKIPDPIGVASLPFPAPRGNPSRQQQRRLPFPSPRPAPARHSRAASPGPAPSSRSPGRSAWAPHLPAAMRTCAPGPDQASG